MEGVDWSETNTSEQTLWKWIFGHFALPKFYCTHHYTTQSSFSSKIKLLVFIFSPDGEANKIEYEHSFWHTRCLDQQTSTTQIKAYSARENQIKEITLYVKQAREICNEFYWDSPSSLAHKGYISIRNMHFCSFTLTSLGYSVSTPES